MGTHPIFESDFDCLTGCCLRWPQTAHGLPPVPWRLHRLPLTRLAPPRLPLFWRDVLWVPVHLVIFKRLVKFWQLVMVLLVFMVFAISKLRRWLNSHLVSRVWH